MSAKQHAVMWLGLTLVLVRFFGTDQFSLIWSDIVSGSSPGKILGGGPGSPANQYIHNPPSSRGAGSVIGGGLSSGTPGLRA